MEIDQVVDSPWTRKHDDPRINLIPRAAKIMYPRSLKELIEICRNRPPGQRLKAAGSHWSLSRAAISDHTFIETHDPRNVHRAMGRTLHNVLPACLHPDVLDRLGTLPASEIGGTLVHVEAGKRIYQLYAELDQVDPLTSPSTLAGYIFKKYGNAAYRGPWAFSTLGGAGGQTIGGAISTGTHGADFDRPPIADSVVALHLVTDGGRHYWIESVTEEFLPQLTDDFRMNLVFGPNGNGGARNFELIRDNELLDAVLVSAGRFGIIYSVVLSVVPQYNLYERRRLHVWQDFKHQIKDLNSPLYKDTVSPHAADVPSTPVVGDCRSLQIAVCLTPHDNFERNLAGITKRWQLVLSEDPPGRRERVGRILGDGFDEHLQAPRFAHAGNNHGYSPDPDHPLQPDDPSPLSRMCANASFLQGVLEVAIEELENLVESDGAVVGGGIAAIAALGGGGLALLFPALFLVLLILKEILEHFDDDDRFGEHMENIKNRLLDPDEPDPAKRSAGLFAWQLIVYLAFQMEQKDREYEAISYAVMDQKNYKFISCESNVDSVEVFFNVLDDRLVAFVDALLAYEKTQEVNGLACAGYVALRFMGPSRALLGMQKHAPTCSVEVACLKDVSGGQDLIDYAVRLALNPNIGGVLHWGEKNEYTMADVERLYGDSISSPGGALGAWRAALARLTDNGMRDGFSSEFTRRSGLEVVSPKAHAIWTDEISAEVGDLVTIHWETSKNPPGTRTKLSVVRLQGWIELGQNLPLDGSRTYQIESGSPHAFVIEVQYELNGVRRSDSNVTSIVVT